MRGFKRQSLAGDKGFYMRNTFKWKLPIKNKKQEAIGLHNIFFAYDLGVVDPKDRAAQGGQLEGLALGIESIAAFLEFSFTWSQALRKPAYFRYEDTSRLSVRLRF